MDYMNKSVYLDATVPSYYHETRSELATLVDITQKWWDTQRQNYDLFVSDYTLAELLQGEYPKKDKLIELISDLPSFDATDEIYEIAELYINQFVIAPQAFAVGTWLARRSVGKG